MDKVRYDGPSDGEIKRALAAREIVQWHKYLPGKHKVSSFTPSTKKKVRKP